MGQKKLPLLKPPERGFKQYAFYATKSKAKDVAENVRLPAFGSHKARVMAVKGWHGAKYYIVWKGGKIKK